MNSERFLDLSLRQEVWQIFWGYGGRVLSRFWIFFDKEMKTKLASNKD